MTKANYVIRERKGFRSVEGYISECGQYGIDKRNGTCQPNKQFWYVTDLASGLGIDGQAYPTRKEAVDAIDKLDKLVTENKLRVKPKYLDACRELNEYLNKSNTEVKTESEDKTMSKNTKAKANTAPKAKRPNYKAENEALKKELEILKKQIEELTRVEKTTIDSFDVEGYLASRDNMHRITEELVEAIGNTKGLKFVFKNANKEVVPFSGTEWLYVSGETEADTKERKDIFKAMSFKWSAPEKAWVLAPYPIRSKKAWGAKKARKAMANA